MAIAGNDITIREASAKDAEIIADILYEGFIEFRPLYTSEAFNATVIPASKVIERMKEGKVWLALYKGNVVGTLASRDKADGFYIRGMAVSPAARGLKIGKLLLNVAEEEAMKKGHKRIFLSTTPFLFSAISLYEKAGFIQRGRKEFFGTALFIMDKNL